MPRPLEASYFIPNGPIGFQNIFDAAITRAFGYDSSIKKFGDRDSIIIDIKTPQKKSEEVAIKIRDQMEEFQKQNDKFKQLINVFRYELHKKHQMVS